MEVDVLIVGCGPAGLTLAAQLSAFPDIKTCIVDQKGSRMLLGRTDGLTGVSLRECPACHQYYDDSLHNIQLLLVGLGGGLPSWLLPLQFAAQASF
jgi:Thi4 family